MSEAKHCSDCKHHSMMSNTAHQQRCQKFKEDEVPIPCVVARGDPDKCGNEGKLWEGQ